MDKNQKGLLYLFETPYEPLTTPRANGTITYQQTDGEDEATEESSDGSEPYIIQKLDNILDQLEMLKKVPKGVPYSQFDPVHLGAAKELTTLFMEYVDKPDYWEYAGAVKESVNEGLFIFSLSFVIIRAINHDSRLVPAIYECFPNMFISQPIMDKCKERVKRLGPGDAKIVVDDCKDFSGTEPRDEHRLAYWREDYGMNAHHWHWHLVFNDIDINPCDRKGEVFYYMHSQMLGRYDWERLSNGLSRVVPLDNWHEPIPDGYFSDLTIDNTFNHYGSRPDNMSLLKDKISYLEEKKHKFREAIHDGYMKKGEDEDIEYIQLSDNVVPWEEELDNGEIKKHKRGIDHLGDALEASNLSVDSIRYGSLHNEGHGFLARIHDPEKHHLRINDPEGHHGARDGVMNNTATAMRDPVFYRWHKFIDDIFQEYKRQQEPYDDKELVFGSVQLESVSVKSDELDDNMLETGWTHRTIEVTRGLDFDFTRHRSDHISVRSQHLTHKKFSYNLEVRNNEKEPLDVTVRLYMAPKFNEMGKKMTYMDQRQLWAEMDRYHTKLDPGLNSLERSSMESSITILEKNTFRELEKDPPVKLNDDGITIPNEDETLNATPSAFCGCGWPQHLLLPKGTAEGMYFQIFALISDWKDDKVDGSDGGKTCSNAASYCGILNKKYPDKRPMGYPFDRRTNYTVNDCDIHNAADLASALPNAALSDDIKITFKDDDIFPESE